MTTLKHLAIGALLGLSLTSSNCHKPKPSSPPAPLLSFFDYDLLNTPDTSAATIPDTSSPNDTIDSSPFPTKYNPPTTISFSPETTATADITQHLYTDATAIDLSQETTSTTCPKITNIWYDQIKVVIDDKTLTVPQQQEKLGEIVNDFIKRSGGEFYVNINQYQPSKDFEMVCKGALSEGYRHIVGLEAVQADAQTKDIFTNSLAPYLCQKKKLTYNPKDPVVKFKAN